MQTHLAARLSYIHCCTSQAWPDTRAAKLPNKGASPRAKYGHDFFRRIGTKGGSTSRDRHGPAFYREIGRLGGETTKQRLGTEHYARIGRIGGIIVHAMRGADGADGEATTSNADNASR